MPSILLIAIFLIVGVSGDSSDVPGNFLGTNCFPVPRLGKSSDRTFGDVVEERRRPEPVQYEHEHVHESSGKNPMVVLNELAMYNRIRHQYVLVNEEGPAHNKRFTIAVKLIDAEGRLLEEYLGGGSRKKEAQHAAAANALRSTAFALRPTKPKTGSKKSDQQIIADPGVCPISTINTLSQRSRTPVTYTVVDERGPPHDKTFVTECEFRGVRTEGVGKSKKASKREAAQRMIHLLNRPTELNQFSDQPRIKKRNNKNRKKKRNTVVNSQSDSVGSKILQWSDRQKYSQSSILDSIMANVDVSKWENEFRAREDLPKINYPKTGFDSSKITESKPSVGDASSMEFKKLDRAAKDSKYDVKMSELKTKDGNYYSVVELKSLNEKNIDIICFGEDRTIDEAHERSTREALKFLALPQSAHRMNLTSHSSIGNWKRSIGTFLGAVKSALNSLSSGMSREALLKYSKYANEFREL